MPKIRQDSNGSYVTHDGYVFRPVFSVGYQHLEVRGEYQVGEKVKARFNGGCLCEIIFEENDDEIWYNHGEFKSGHEKTFKPDYDTW